MTEFRRSNPPVLRALAAAALLSLGLAAAPAQAQVGSATIRGVVSGVPQEGAAVTAVNQANGNTYRTRTRGDGSYVLVGVAPGSYEVLVAGAAGQESRQQITVQVGETAALDLALGTQQIVITANAQRQGVRDPQVGTNVHNRVIEALPQSTRNFLSSADLAPGVRLQEDQNGFTRIRGGAQDQNNANVYIDGVGQKNNILRGGLTGQDGSRGNPFPQSAIAEYKVLTQNYKAEFEQVSSVAITAITKSGTNETHGEVYVDRTGTNWRAMSPLEKQREADGVSLPSSTKNEFGFSLGGAIKPDTLHYFFAYDGKRIGDSRQIVAQHAEDLPDAGIVPELLALQGSQVDDFTEHLLFGRIDAELDADRHLTVTARLRRENDQQPEDRNLSVPGNDRERVNDETRLDAVHEWSFDDWFAESRAGYEDYLFNPKSAASEPFIKYKVSTGTPQDLDASADVLFVGGSPDAQYRRQKGLYLAQDITYTGAAGHVVKGGIKVKQMKYELSGTAFSVDRVETLIDTTTGLPYYDGSGCTGTNISSDGLESDQCRILPAVPDAGVDFDNTQVGIFIQDDWTVTPRLELNIGVRWDYETNMLNNRYVTPADRVQALLGEDGRTVSGPSGDIVAPPGQTYAESLALGGVDITQYISDGSSRKKFAGAIAPRLGASYDLFGDRSSVIFGGWGRAYDRAMANHALDELQKNAQAGGEVWLVKNDLEMPYSDQFSLGLRQAVGDWNAEAIISVIHGKNQFQWFGGNRDPQGGYGNQSPIDPLWGGPAGYGTLVLGDTIGENKTTALFLKAEKPYTAASGWTATVAYTYSDAKTKHRDWNDEIFDWVYGRAGQGFNRSILVDEHRIVGAYVNDRLLPWGMTLALKGTWASGLPRKMTDCTAGFNQCVYVEGDSPSFRQVDLSLAKAFRVGPGELTLRGDVLNLFNAANYGGFDDWIGGPAEPPNNEFGGDNANLHTPNSMRGPMRTLRVALSYKF